MGKDEGRVCTNGSVGWHGKKVAINFIIAVNLLVSIQCKLFTKSIGTVS